jgi:hypothetical protein
LANGHIDACSASDIFWKSSTTAVLYGVGIVVSFAAVSQISMVRQIIAMATRIQYMYQRDSFVSIARFGLWS